MYHCKIKRPPVEVTSENASDVFYSIRQHGEHKQKTERVLNGLCCLCVEKYNL